MRIGVIGDTHGDVYCMEKAAKAAGLVDLWLHTGDFYRDGMWLASRSGVPVTVVAGNCDGRGEAKPDEFVEVAGYRIWLTHGHRHGVKRNLDDLRDWARRYEADIVVYGHTHQADILQEPECLFFNPGSASLPRHGKLRTCGLLELAPDRNGILSRLISIH